MGGSFLGRKRSKWPEPFLSMALQLIEEHKGEKIEAYLYDVLSRFPTNRDNLVDVNSTVLAKRWAELAPRPSPEELGNNDDVESQKRWQAEMEAFGEERSIEMRAIELVLDVLRRSASALTSE